MADQSIGARIRAARVLGGFSGVPALAAQLEALGLNGMGRTKLYEAERGEFVPAYHQLSEIATACELPVEFFSADLQRMGEISENPRTVIAEAIAAAVARSEARRGGSVEDPPPQREAGQ